MPRKGKLKWLAADSLPLSIIQERIQKRRERHKFYMRRVRASETEEQAKIRREKNRIRMRQYRALETPQQAERRREKGKLRMRLIRALKKLGRDSTVDHGEVLLDLDYDIDDPSTETVINEQKKELKEETETCNGESQ